MPENILQIWLTFLTDKLPLVWDVTVVFFLSAVVLLIVLSVSQYSIERRRHIVLLRKEQYVPQINRYLASGRNELAVNGRLDYYALADALTEVNSFLPVGERRKTRDLAMEMEVDTYLLHRYRTSWSEVKKKFFFTKMLFLYSPRLKSFFERMIQKHTEFEMMVYSVYGFAKLAETDEDLEHITDVLQGAYNRGISLKFSEFVYMQALVNVPYRELEIFLNGVLFRAAPMVMVRSVVAAMGDTKNPEYAPLLKRLFARYREDEQFVITYIRSFHKIGAMECDVIAAYYQSHAPVTRIVCSRTGLDLCGNEALSFLYVYFFDENYYVRRNIFETCKQHGIGRAEILEIVTRNAADKINDAFFLDGLNAFCPVAEYDNA
ncbi:MULTISPECIES: hypothetical protein [Sulfurimonas]|uniref:HEAT repeat domain-containing protein n=1 Tax=Sulfurimonas diazotrophicus TaxID=3131939 RepID=A0ABZ3H8S5_9BACT